MRYWIRDRQRALPQFYRKSEVENIFQAAADVFFTNVQVVTNDLKVHTFRPRQMDNMNLGNCDKSILIWFLSEESIGALLQGESDGAECLYPASQSNLSISLNETK